jgi:3-methyladenine DNA glycosylase/8-oxoguanine DNA glycosylase
MYKLKRSAYFRLRPRLPYDFVLTVRKPAGWHWFTPFEVWENGVIRTGFWFRPATGDKIPVGISACMDNDAIAVSVYSTKKIDAKSLAKLRRTLVTALGADEDVRPLYTLMRRNPILKELVRRLYGMHEAWGSDIFPSLTLAVLLQMAPIKRSQDMWNCLIRRYGATVRFDGISILLWPTEAAIAGLSEKELAECKLGYRAKSLHRIALQLLKGFPEIEELAAMPAETAREKLMELYGVGEYSAGFADPHPGFMLDVWSVKIFHRLIFGKPVPDGDPRSAIEKTTAAAERLWGDWRGYIMTYVLNDLPYLEKKFGITAT